MSKEIEKAKLFAVEDYFKKMEDDENKIVYVNIPYFDVVKGQKTAILVDKNSSNFALKNFWVNFKYNYYSSYSFYNDDIYNTTYDESISYGSVDSFDKASFFDVGEITKHDDSIPIFDIWNESYSSSKIDNIEIEKFKDIVSRFDMKFKSEFLVSISNFIPTITKLNHEFTLQLKQISRNITENWFTMSEKEIIAALETVIEFFNNFRNKIISKYLNFYEELFSIYKDYQKRLESPLYTDLKADIKYKLIQLKTINDINKSSLVEVETNFKIRDLNIEIDCLKDYKKQFKKETYKYIKYIIYKTKNQMRTIRYKMDELDQHSKDYKRLLYQWYIKKFILKIWKKHTHKLLYLKKKEILEIDKNIKIEEKVFMSNLQAYSKFKKINIVNRISKSFNIDFKNYNLKSREYKKTLNKKIHTCKELIKELEIASFHKIYDLERKIEEKNFHDNLKLSQAEYNWDKKTSEDNFKMSLNYNFKKAKRFFDNVVSSKQEQLSVIKDIILKIRKKYERLSIYNIEVNKKINELLNVNDNYERFSLTDSFIGSLLYFASTKNKIVSKKFIRDFISVQKMLSAIDSIGIELEEFLVPYNKLSLVEKIKLKLIKFILEKPLLVFVQDDVSLRDQEQRVDFFKVLNSLSYKYGFTYVFVSEDISLIEKYFDYVAVLFNNSLIESGYVKDLKENSIHPYTKHVFLNAKNKRDVLHALELNKKIKPWIHSDVIELKEERHYLFATSKEFRLWTKVIKKNDNDFHLSWYNQKELTAQQENNYIESNYKSQFDGSEVFFSIKEDTTNKIKQFQKNKH